MVFDSDERDLFLSLPAARSASNIEKKNLSFASATERTPRLRLESKVCLLFVMRKTPLI